MPLSGVFCAAAALTLVKGDEGVELLEKLPDCSLLIQRWNQDGHASKRLPRYFQES